jgi:Alpha-glucosidases, family 31 of glycosyl hydrolases
MQLTRVERDAEGAALWTTEGKMHVAFCTPAIARIRYTLDEDFSGKKSLMVIRRAERPAVEWRVAEAADHVELATDLVKIRIDKATCAFSYWDADGRLLAKEPDSGGKTLERIDVVRTVFDGAAKVEMDTSADGLRARADHARQVVDRKACHTKLAFEWQPGEALYGLGSHEEGMMNLRGKVQYLYQQNMKAVVPVLVSTRGYGILMDSCSLMIYRDDAFGSYIWTDVDDEMDYYFIYGPEFDDIVRGVRHLTGDAPMLPKWAYGYIQSKERYKTQDELIGIVREYRRRGLPLDCIVLDWMSWPGELWGQKTLRFRAVPGPGRDDETAS